MLRNRIPICSPPEVRRPLAAALTLLFWGAALPATLNQSANGGLAPAFCRGAALNPPASARPATGWCPRPPPGGELPDPVQLRSRDGRLELTLVEHNERTADGAVRYCFVDGQGHQAPTLRIRPGDELVIHLIDALTDLEPVAGAMAMPADPGHGPGATGQPGRAGQDPCTRGRMDPVATNLHFHGMTLPARCHQDEVLKTSVMPGDAPFEYRLRIPADEPAGLYWYHPHIHGFSARQVGGGASGAIVVEGIERSNPALRGLPDRVLVIRDQALLNPGASGTGADATDALRDREGDLINTGTGAGTPARDLSVNFVPVPWPQYMTPVVRVRPVQSQLWRVLNASSVTYLDLIVMQRRGAVFRPGWMGLAAVDGVPLRYGGAPAPATIWRSSMVVPPGGRIEFILPALPEGAEAQLITRGVDTGSTGENDPSRPLLSIQSRADAPALQQLPAVASPAGPAQRAWVGDVPPVRERHLYFSEDPVDPAHPDAPGHFYITVEGQQPKPFDPAAGVPDIVARQGDVEDWIIENRTSEVHVFHIHQLHFQLREWAGAPINEPFVRDSINVPYWTASMQHWPSVRVRMDFRGPDTVGTFVYHCHLLDHEDAGMMGLIRVDPEAAPAAAQQPD